MRGCDREYGIRKGSCVAPQKDDPYSYQSSAGRFASGWKTYTVCMAMSADQNRLIEWLLRPKAERVPRTQSELAGQMGCEPSQLSAWKRDVEFLQAWDSQYLRTIGSPETKMKIMQTLMATATDPDDPKHVQAAKTFFEIEGSLRPSKTQVDVNLHGVKPSELTDDQLDELLAAKAGDELAQRREVS